jgi:hypothetical protein
MHNPIRVAHRILRELNWINQASNEALQPLLVYSAHVLTTSLPSNEVLMSSGSVDSAVLQAIRLRSPLHLQSLPDAMSSAGLAAGAR